MRRLIVILLFLLAALARAAEVMPPAPKNYFNDYAGVVSAPTARNLDAQLQSFERQTSNQIVVAIFPKMQTDSSIEDYTVRIAQRWGVGQKGRDNGAVLFVFVADRQLYIQVGYGLEGALPDAIAKRIIEREIVPRLRSGDWDGAMSAGVSAMMAATKGEYKGTGRIAGDRTASTTGSLCMMALPLLIMLVVLRAAFRRRRGMIYYPGGFSPTRGGRGSWGGGGGFRGGGGSFGGGGAGGRW